MVEGPGRNGGQDLIWIIWKQEPYRDLTDAGPVMNDLYYRHLLRNLRWEARFTDPMVLGFMCSMRGLLIILGTGCLLMAFLIIWRLI